MTIVIGWVTVVGDGVVTVNIVDRSQVLIMIRSHGSGPGPNIVDQINVRIFHSTIQQGDNNLVTTFSSRPGVANTCLRQSPLLVESWIVSSHAIRIVACLIQTYFVIRFRVINFRQRRILIRQRPRVSSVRVVNGHQSGNRLDLILDSMVEAVERWVQPESMLEPKADTPPTQPVLTIVPPPAAEEPEGQPTTVSDEAAEPKALAPVLPLPTSRASADAGDESEPVLDEARLKASSMGNADLEGILLRTFVNHIRPRLQRLRDACQVSDASAIEFEAHGLKGMCGTIGAMACADVFSRIERLGREKRLEPVAPMLDYAEIEVSRVELLIAPRTKAA